jgi:DNA polymerase-1
LGWAKVFNNSGRYDAYFGGYPGVRQYLDRVLEEARATGIVRTITGRRRLVPEINNPNAQVRGAAERAAVNMPIQGTAADILKRAMIDLGAELASREREWPGARMILTVHDELVFEAPAECAPALVDVIRERMEHAFTLAVPLTVDVGVGPNWTDAKP